MGRQSSLRNVLAASRSPRHKFPSTNAPPTSGVRRGASNSARHTGCPRPRSGLSSLSSRRILGRGSRNLGKAQRRRKACVSPIEPIERNGDGCFEPVLGLDSRCSDWLPMTPEAGTQESPGRVATAVQAFKRRRSALGDGRVAFARPKCRSGFSGPLTSCLDLSQAIAGSIRHRRCLASKQASSSAPAAVGT